MRQDVLLGVRFLVAVDIDAALALGREAGYAVLAAPDCREKDKDSVSYNIVWGTGALAILMLLPAVMTIIKG